MGAAENFAGKRFGRLVALRLVGHNANGVRLWRWRCVCGKEIDRISLHIKAGRQVSCGCHRNEQSSSRKTHGMSQSRTYRCWIEMKARCRGKDELSRKHYTRRGIKVCGRWSNSFAKFLSDMGECPPGMTIERILNDQGYRPGNCRWASQAEQLRNTRRTIRVNIDGIVMCLKDACAMRGVNYDRVRSRIRKGQSPQAALG